MDPIERIDIDSFDVWLDQMVRGAAIPAPENAVEPAEAAVWLEQKGKQIVSRSLFGKQLIAQLQHVGTNSSEAANALPSTQRLRRRVSSHEPANVSRRALAATAAALLIMLPALILLVRFFDGGSDEPTIPAPVSGLAQFEAVTTCTVDQPENMALVGTPTNENLLNATIDVEIPETEGMPTSVPAMLERDLPTGPPPPDADVEEATTVLDTLAACMREGDFVTAEGLLGDDYFLRMGMTRAQSATVQAGSPLTAVDSPEPKIVDARSLPNGRIGILLEHDLWNFELQQFFVFVRSDHGWQIDEVVFVTTKPALGTPSPVAVTSSSSSSRIEKP